MFSDAVEGSEGDVTSRGCRHRQPKSTTPVPRHLLFTFDAGNATATVPFVNSPWKPTAFIRRCLPAIALAVVTAGCSGTELEIEATFDDTWTVVVLANEGTTVDLTDQPIEIEIDTGEAAVRGRTTCQQLFGSYTLVDEGENSGDASFTIPSPAASGACEAADRAVHTALVDALESVTQWQREASTLVLSSPTGTQLTLEAQSLGE